jgi:hypothetical protein
MRSAFGLQLGDFGVDVDRARLRRVAQFGDACFQLRERLLEIQESRHSRGG